MLPKTKTKTNPNSRACLPCREKHLKCDGQPPPCNRCAAAGADLACTYVQSRRGRRAPTARSSTAATHDRPAAAQPSQMLAFSTPAASHVADSLGSHGQQGFPSAPLANRPTHSGAEQQLQQNDALSEDTISMPYIDSGKPDDDYLITLYYQFIHPAHPFLLPLKLYRQNRNIFPDHLKQAVYYIASFHSSVSSEQHEDEFEALFGPEVPNDAFKVQSLILITLASYARFQRDRGNKALNAAISVAYQIGLNLEDFFRGDEALFRESWRRTWWELYSIAGLISLISGVNVRLSQPTDMTLPYECDAYNECQTRYMGSARDMKERYRTDSTTTWSSFAYRVEAMRILSMVLDLSLSTSSSDKLAAEAAVSGWVLSLPEGKRDGLRENGETDEVMSCALMIIHLAGICLHLPQSSLIRTGDFRTVCGNDFRPLASDSPKLHQAAALRSANALARLLTTHSDLRTLSPCFSCAVAYSSVVLLAEYSIHAIPKPLYLGENLQLELNALQSIGHTWPIAGVVRGQLAAFARDTMRRPSESNATELLDLYPSLIDEQWLQDLVGDTTALPI